MDFSFSEEQTLLQDSIARFIQNDYEFEKRQQLVGTELGFSEDNWKQFADLGWFGVLFSEADGGGYAGSFGAAQASGPVSECLRQGRQSGAAPQSGDCRCRPRRTGRKRSC